MKNMRDIIEELYLELSKFKEVCSDHTTKLTKFSEMLLTNPEVQEDAVLRDIIIDITLFWKPHLESAIQGKNVIKDLTSLIERIERWRQNNDS